MNFIRTGESPATTVNRKIANAFSSARAKVYDTLGPYFNPDYIPPTDPRRVHGMAESDPERSFLAKGMETVVGPLRGGNVRALSMQDTGIDLFDPSPMGEIHAASSFLGGIPRKEKEVLDLLERFGREGWNRGQVVEELKHLGHNPLDFMDAIKARFGGGGLGSGAPLDLSAAAGYSPTLGTEPTVAQRMRSMGGLKPPTYAGTQDMGTGKAIKLYNLTEDIIDPLTGQVKHGAGSTVSENTLKLYGITPDRRESTRLPNEFENLLMKADPGYVGGKAARELPSGTPRAGARAFNDDTARQHLDLTYNAPDDLDEDSYALRQQIESGISQLFEQFDKGQHKHISDFFDMVQEGMTSDDALRELGKAGLDRSVQRRLRDFWNDLGSM